MSPSFTEIVEHLCDAVESGSSCLNLKTIDPNKSNQDWRAFCRVDEGLSCVGTGNTNTPLVLSPFNQLYLRRYFLYEKGISSSLQRFFNSDSTPNFLGLEINLSTLFGDVTNNKQALAAKTALLHPFTIISGGPGTGKTTTVAKILHLFSLYNILPKEELCLFLAPTGKAAERLQLSINSYFSNHSDFSTPLVFPPGSTIHRALGYIPNSIEFRHHKKNTLSAKLIILDEASMVDLPLMAKLLDAIDSSTKIILLGDPDQLSSVQIGTILADLIDTAEKSDHPLHQAHVALTHSYRNQGSIQEICSSIRLGNTEKSWGITLQKNQDSTGLVQSEPLPQNVLENLKYFVLKYWLEPIRNKKLAPEEKLTLLNQFKILTPIHHGKYGTKNINACVLQILQKYLVSQNIHELISIQENDSSLELYNGDSGLVCEFQGSPSICSLDAQNNPRFTPLHLAPAFEPSWALTIHRTQGSEYEHILVIVPPLESSNKILSKELLYTALSRAKSSITLWSHPSDFKKSLESRVSRASGLKSILLENKN